MVLGPRSPQSRSLEFQYHGKTVGPVLSTAVCRIGHPRHQGRGTFVSPSFSLFLLYGLSGGAADALQRVNTIQI
jgi:hypothetical protein